MSSEPSKPGVFDKLETQSSLYQKLPPSLRRQVDRAIVDHDPPTYRAVFDKFKLAAHAVSFTAFYRYARRIRTNTALVELASLALPEGKSVDEFLPEIVGERFLEAALDEETSPQTLHRLAVTHRIAIQNHIACHHFAAAAPNRARAEARDIAPIRARMEARDSAANRARAEASGSLEASEGPAASGKDDDDLHLLENYLAARQKAAKAREQAAQQTIAAMSAAADPAEPPPADLVPHSSRVPPSAFPVPISSPESGAGAPTRGPLHVSTPDSSFPSFSSFSSSAADAPSPRPTNPFPDHVIPAP